MRNILFTGYNKCYNLIYSKGLNLSAVKIRKIGNSLGIIIPKDVQEALEVSEGDFLDLNQIGNKKIILQNTLSHHSEWVFEGEQTDEDLEWSEAELEDEKDYVPKWGNMASKTLSNKRK